MKVLAFLQNQWFKNPARVEAMYAENPELRNEYIKRFLFMGCLTGRRLKSALGEDLCQDITWEEASRRVAGHASASFPPDVAHIAKAIEIHRPNVVLVFGKIAENGALAAKHVLAIRSPAFSFKLLIGPHPAARQNPMPALQRIAKQLQSG